MNEDKGRFLALLVHGSVPDASDDVKWFFDVHMPKVAAVKSVALYGNHEDSPTTAVLYDVERPDVDSVPICTITFPK